MIPILEARGLTKRFGRTQALAGLDMVAEPGRVVALLGPNGAGKTTFVRAVATLLRPDAGSLQVAGIDALRHPAWVRQLIGLAGQFAAVEPAMTGRENLEMVGRLFALVTWSLAVGIALGFAVGFRMHGSVTAGLAALGLCVLFSFAFEWVFITIGLVAGTAQAAQGMSVLMTVLVFVSSAYVPVSRMPGWLRPVAEHQPVTPMVNAVRGLVGGPQAEALLDHTTAYYVGLSLIWAAAIVAVFGVVAAVRFSRR